MNMAQAPTDTAEESFDEWTALKLVTQDTRAGLLADIVGHPKGMASVPELDYMSPRIERSAIDEHLRKLVDAGVVEKTQLPAGERSRDLPYTFYSLTEQARDLFDRNNIFDEAIWQDQYAKVEKTDKILEIQRAPRPSEE